LTSLFLSFIIEFGKGGNIVDQPQSSVVCAISASSVVGFLKEGYASLGLTNAKANNHVTLYKSGSRRDLPGRKGEMSVGN
jgi:hypothetical protein